MTEFGIQSSVSDFKAGVPYRFVLTNEGVVNHKFMIMPPLGHEQMGMAMIEASELPGGATATFDYNFVESAYAGDLEFACYTAGHYEAGMKLPITME